MALLDFDVGNCTSPLKVASSMFNGTLAALWMGEIGPLRVTSVSWFHEDDTLVTTSVTLENIGHETLSDVDYHRSINPDQEQVSVCERCPCRQLEWISVLVQGNERRPSPFMCVCVCGCDSPGPACLEPATMCCSSRFGRLMVLWP